MISALGAVAFGHDGSSPLSASGVGGGVGGGGGGVRAAAAATAAAAAATAAAATAAVVNDTAAANDTAATGVIQFLDEDLSFPDYIRTTCMVVCVIILGVGVVGNMMVPIVILKSKDMRNSTNIFLMNLSIADLMVLLICTPTVFVEVNSRPETWVLGEELCEYCDTERFFDLPSGRKTAIAIVDFDLT